MLTREAGQEHPAVAVGRARWPRLTGPVDDQIAPDHDDLGGVSGIDFAEQDELTVLDLIDRLRYERSDLRFSADYVRGRCVKTDITVRGDGTATVETRNRGEAAIRWLRRLQGKRLMEVIQTPPAPGGRQPEK